MEAGLRKPVRTQIDLGGQEIVRRRVKSPVVSGKNCNKALMDTGGQGPCSELQRGTLKKGLHQLNATFLTKLTGTNSLD